MMKFIFAVLYVSQTMT